MIHRVLLFIILCAYFSAWAVLKAPFQAPDEFAHYLRAKSIDLYPWAMPARDFSHAPETINPMVDVLKFHELPFHKERKIHLEELRRIKRIAWNPPGPKRIYATTAYSYPPLFYYFVEVFDEACQGLGLTPFTAHFWIRILVGICAALIWLVVYDELAVLGRFRAVVFWVLVLNPMLAFISSSINPDSFIIPLSNLFVLRSFRALRSGRGLISATIILASICLMKPTGLLLAPALAAVAALALYHGGRKSFWQITYRSAIIGGLGAILPYLTFYRISPPAMHAKPLHLTLIEYIGWLPGRIVPQFISYWGQLGWLDYQVDDYFYLAIAILLGFNLIALVWTRKSLDFRDLLKHTALFALVFFVLIIIGEFNYLSSAGYTIQGRYFLPVGIAIALLTAHRFWVPKGALLLTLAAMNITFVFTSVQRYYGPHLKVFYRTLPF